MSSPSDTERREVASLTAKLSELPHGAAKTDTRSAGYLGLICHALIWLLTLCLASIAALRVFYYDGAHFLIWLNAFTRYVYLPAYAFLAWACWCRRWRLALANAAMVALHLCLIVPDFLPDRRFESTAGNLPPSAMESPRVRIFFANVTELNTEHAAMIEEIREANPDVIVLAEFSWLWRTAFANSFVVKEYPFGNGIAEAHYGAVNVFSRLPVKSEKQDWVAGRDIETLDVPVGRKTLRIIGLHAPRPMRMRDYDYDGYWKRALPMLLAEAGPLAIVGDCNATQYSRVYKELTSSQLRSAHEDRGRGYATSWPNAQLLLPPIRIDQAFISPEVECLSIREGVGRGSDHKPLILDLQLRTEN